MSQTDYNIENAAGAIVRQRMNEIFEAIQSCNAGSSAPTDTRPGMLWLDTGVSPAVLRRRNAADDAWLLVTPEKATEAQALAATDNDTVMTPLRTRQAIDDRAPELNPPLLTQAQVEDDESTTEGLVSGQRLAQASAANRWRQSAVIASDSGSEIDFSGLPSGLTELELMFHFVEQTGAGYLVRLGVGGAVIDSGYHSSSVAINAGSGSQSISTSGMVARAFSGAALFGTMRLQRFDGNKWLQRHSLWSDRDPPIAVRHGVGTVDLGGELDLLRVSPTQGDSFTGGSIRLRYY